MLINVKNRRVLVDRNFVGSGSHGRVGKQTHTSMGAVPRDPDRAEERLSLYSNWGCSFKSDPHLTKPR